MPKLFLNRSASDRPDSWSVRGSGLTVTEVYRKTVPYNCGEGFGNSGVRTVKYSPMRHMIYLKLSGNLPPGGPYTISNSASGMSTFSFSFNDKITRAIGIRANQVGYRPGDVSKLAYLGLWVPGASEEGAINFGRTYSIRSFSVIDSLGHIVFTGPVTQRVAPTTSETGAGDVALFNYASATQTPLTITDVSRTNPVVVSFKGIPPANGDIVWIYNVDANTVGSTTPRLTDLNGGRFTVTGVTASSFQLSGVDGTGFAHPYAGGGGTVYKSTPKNRAGTYVFGLDFSSWKTGDGEGYRIYIPGLGVSDPFEVSDKVWSKVAANAAAGEYHLRSGCALDGRFGYARPSCFDGTGAMRIVKSRLPYAFSDLCIGGSGVSTAAGAVAPWITTEKTPWFGSWFDAGDYVMRIAETAQASSNLLDLYERMPATASATSYNIPKSSSVLDASIYSAVEALPDIVHSAIWNLDAYRRVQNLDGSVPSGLGVDSGVGTNAFEPSWHFRGLAYTYAPDHFSNFAYAGAAAKLAKILQLKGHTKLCDLWKASAVDAWAWANNLYTNSTARDIYYNTILGVQAKAGWSNTVYNANVATAQTTAGEYRLYAAGHLFALTGDSTYGSIITSAYPFDLYSVKGSGAWEYANSVGARVTTAAAIKADLVSRVDKYIVGYSRGTVSYRNLQHAGLNPNFGLGGTDLSDAAPSLVRAHLLTGAPKYLETLQCGLSHILGANQIGVCFTSGIGTRNIRGTLFADAVFGAGVIPAGITNYAWTLPVLFAYALNFGAGPLNGIVENPDPNYQADYENERTMSIFHGAFPTYEAIYENHYIIAQMEFTIQQTIIPQLYAGLYLSGWDGNAP
jgi:endoglucanase